MLRYYFLTLILYFISCSHLLATPFYELNYHSQAELDKQISTFTQKYNLDANLEEFLKNLDLEDKSLMLHFIRSDSEEKALYFFEDLAKNNKEKIILKEHILNTYFDNKYIHRNLQGQSEALKKIRPSPVNKLLPQVDHLNILSHEELKYFQAYHRIEQFLESQESYKILIQMQDDFNIQLLIKHPNLH